MRISIISFTQNGALVGRKIEKALTAQGDLCALQAGGGLEKSSLEKSGGRRLRLLEWTKEAFAAADALVFVGATGIAVRAIAPYLKGKTVDPAVVVVDERGIYAISLLSGHLGGANTLTGRISEAVGAQPVITTATDINGKFAVDEWAGKQGLFISDMARAKGISAAILRGETVGFFSDVPVHGDLPPELWESSPELWESSPPPGTEWGIHVSMRLDLSSDFGISKEQLLQLVPRCLVVGVGCRRDTQEARIRQAVEEVLQEGGLRMEAVKKLVSIDLKKDEPGLVAYGKHLGVPFEVFSKEELLQASLPVPTGLQGDFVSGFSASDFVKSVTGVDNVCERAAVLGCERDAAGRGAKTKAPVCLLVKKTIRDSVTVAVAMNADGCDVVF